MSAVAISRRGRRARRLVWLAMPALAVINQYLAMRTAQALSRQELGLAWLGRAAASPWVHAWIACEILTFAVWMTVLSGLSLSAAFPMTALGYVLVIGLGWIGFGEPATWAQALGGAAILAGVWLLGDGEGRA